jgi:hypothetical protein
MVCLTNVWSLELDIYVLLLRHLLVHGGESVVVPISTNLGFNDDNCPAY